MNLTDSRFLSLLPRAYDELEKTVLRGGGKMPENRVPRDANEKLLRDLDCAVIETLHQLRVHEGEPAFDSARGVFTEGGPVFAGAGIQRGNHVQICVRNPDCVRGHFAPRDL